MTVFIGTMEEIYLLDLGYGGYPCLAKELIKDREIPGYFFEEKGGENKDDFENHIIKQITVDRFSHAFEINGATGEMKPDDGDYFSTIRIFLDNERVIGFQGCDAISDGYVYYWTE